MVVKIVSISSLKATSRAACEITSLVGKAHVVVLQISILKKDLKALAALLKP